MLYRLASAEGSLDTGACVFKLKVPKLAAQAGHTAVHARHYGKSRDIKQEDGLTEFEISVTGKLIMGDSDIC